jgi:hypothetical protein
MIKNNLNINMVFGRPIAILNKVNEVKIKRGNVMMKNYLYPKKI